MSIIEVENLGKKYYISHEDQNVDASMPKSVISGFKKIGKTFINVLKTGQVIYSNYEEFWALRNISFKVEQGERIGIIGVNGAGKTTLLKILSRITDPTEGKAIIKGRTASLLEVGTGFHHELTGRENIFLNGAILGMGRSEMKNKFDEIVEFAGVEKFIDTPVKRYSSGMFVRLAFSVAAHLEPEILLVDEVLAVGDIEFQKKCLGKMEDVSINKGRTVLFVSHDMGRVQQLCTKAILIKNGRLAKKGRTNDVIKTYLQDKNETKKTNWIIQKQSALHKNEIFTPLRLSLIDKDKNLIPAVISRKENVYVELEFKLYKKMSNLTIGISLFNQEGVIIFRSLNTDLDPEQWKKLKVGRNIIRMKLPLNILNESEYRVVLDCSLHKMQWLFNPFKDEIFVKFEIKTGLSDSPFWTYKREGIIAPKLKWIVVNNK